MSDWFYSATRFVCHHPFILTRRPTLLHRERLDRAGAFLVASNHASAYDVPLLIAHSPRRRLDFVSATEVCLHPLFGPFYRAMNAFPLERARPDAPAVRTLLERLSRGRAVVIFPEGRFSLGDQSVVHGGAIRPGLGRIAMLAQVPVLPVVVVGSTHYKRPTAWIPFKGTRYGIVVGEPMTAPKPPADAPPAEIKAAAEAFEEEYKVRMRALHAELLAAAPDLGAPGVMP